ncbi:hypothetical protein ACET3Z_022931 [Daucus carota]
MDPSEDCPQQQYIADSAGQMSNTAPPLHDIATNSNTYVPVNSTMQPPPLPVSGIQHQPAHQDPQAQHLKLVRERLRLSWANQMQEMKSADLKKHNLPISRIKNIMQADEDVKMIAKETTAVFAKACEMFITDMTSRAWINTEESGRRTVQNKDIAAAISKTDIFDFLEEVAPKDESSQQILKATPAEPQNPGYNVPLPDQQHGVGASSVTSAGVEQPPQFELFYDQAGLQNQQSFVPGPQALNQQQPFMPWPQTQQQLDQQSLEQQPEQTPGATVVIDLPSFLVSVDIGFDCAL